MRRIGPTQSYPCEGVPIVNGPVGGSYRLDFEVLRVFEAELRTFDDGVLVLTLSNPGRRNALTEAMRLGVIAALEEAARDTQVRAAVLAGTGEAFCAGQDRAVLRALDAGNVAAWVRGLGEIYDAIRRFPKPIVAAVHGAAAGAGLQMALCCDLRIGTPSEAA